MRKNLKKKGNFRMKSVQSPRNYLDRVSSGNKNIGWVHEF